MRFIPKKTKELRALKYYTLRTFPNLFLVVRRLPKRGGQSELLRNVVIPNFKLSNSTRLHTKYLPQIRSDKDDVYFVSELILTQIMGLNGRGGGGNGGVSTHGEVCTYTKNVVLCNGDPRP
jgi:hypothetical protein